jgi:hypothetical protein
VVTFHASNCFINPLILFVSHLVPFLQADFFKRAVDITKEHRKTVEAKGGKKVIDFRTSLKDSDSGTWPAALQQLRKDVTAFSLSFPAIGFDASKIKK